MGRRIRPAAGLIKDLHCARRQWFAVGKVEAAGFFVSDVAPKVAARRAAADAEDGPLMNLPVESF